MTPETMRAQLAEDPELFRQLTLHIREVFWLTDWRTRRVLFVSPVYETVWKRPCRSLYDDAASWSEPIHPDDRARVVEAFRRDAERGEYEVEYRLLWPDGSVRWIYDRAFPIRDASGEVYRMAGISEDVTERRRVERELAGIRDDLQLRVLERTAILEETAARLEREIAERESAESELRQSERRFREMAENIREVFWLTSGDLTRVLYISPAYERVWGRSRQGLYENPRDWLEAILPEERERVHDEFLRDVRDGRFDVQYRIRRPDGTIRWIHDRGFSVRDDGGQVVRVTGFALDITERKEAELQMEAYQEKLRRLASELVLTEERERRRLAVDLHDGLNQTLTLARMKLSGLRASASDDQARELRELADLIDAANGSVRSLTFELSPPVLHDLGLEAAVDWLAEHVQKAYGLTVRVRYEEEPPIEMDEDVRILTFRAARELLINVAKHAGARRAEVRLARRADELELSVADDGCAGDLEGGIEGAGCKGFGLFSIRERLNHVGGEMRIDAQKGTGTTVVLRCPLALGERTDPCDGREGRT